MVSRPARDRMILDPGSKTLAAERMSGTTVGFGVVRRHPEVVVEALYEEHAICRIDETATFRPGERVEIIPNHACTCANLHTSYDVRSADGGRASWPIAARGW